MEIGYKMCNITTETLYYMYDKHFDNKKVW